MPEAAPFPAVWPPAGPTWLAWTAALAATLVLAAWCTPHAWWRRPNLRALAVLAGGTLGFALLFGRLLPAAPAVADLHGATTIADPCDATATSNLRDASAIADPPGATASARLHGATATADAAVLPRSRRTALAPAAAAPCDRAVRPAAPPGAPAPGARWRVADDLNLRTDRGVRGGRLRVLAAGTIVRTTGAADGDWWRVQARVDGRDVEGWASSLWLRRVDEGRPVP